MSVDIESDIDYYAFSLVLFSFNIYLYLLVFACHRLFAVRKHSSKRTVLLLLLCYHYVRGGITLMHCSLSKFTVV
jgi:hypothetical protein